MSEQNEQPSAPEPLKPKKAKRQTKADRLFQAAQAVLDAVEEGRAAEDALKQAIEQARDELENAITSVQDALEDLRSVREDDYQGWFDNLPENLQQSAVGEKLSSLLDIDLEPTLPEMPEIEEINWEDAENAAQEILDADLPLGFGRD